MPDDAKPTNDHKTVIEPWPVDALMEELRATYEKEGLGTSWKDECPSFKEALKAIQQSLPVGRYIAKSVVGVGGSGIVLRLADNLFPKLDKALKFPRPVGGKVDLIADMLTKEISYLAELRHPGIVSIVDYKTIGETAAYHSLPFYVMDFVEGSPSHKRLRDGDVTEQQFYDLVMLTAQTLAYLHSGQAQKFAHLDIKPENIMMTASGKPVMIDLGTCKRLQSDGAVTIVACTRSLAHPQLVRKLAEDPSDDNRARGELRRSEIDPSWDLWAFALTLLAWLGVDRDSGEVSPDGIYHRLAPYSRKYYMLLAARLLTYSVRSWLAKRLGLSEVVLKDFAISSADDLCEVIARLGGTSGTFARMNRQ